MCVWFSSSCFSSNEFCFFSFLSNAQWKLVFIYFMSVLCSFFLFNQGRAKRKTNSKTEVHPSYSFQIEVDFGVVVKTKNYARI